MIKSSNSNSPNDIAKLEQSPQGMAAWQNAQRYLVEGRHGPAMTSYRNLTQQYPGVSQLWAELSIAAAGDLNFALANEAAKHAAELADDVDLLISIGQQFHRLRRSEEAGPCYRRAVQLDPSSVHAQLTLSSWLERKHELDQAMECVDASLAKHSNDARALYFKALLLHRKGLNVEAEAALRSLLQNGAIAADVKYSATHLLAAVLDSLGNYAEAFVWLEKAKTQQRQLADIAAMEQTYTMMDRARRELLDSITPDTIKRWRQEADALPTPHPLALLAGPPRSGVTLVEQILGAHSDIRVFDEPEAFTQELLTSLHPKPPARCLNFKSLNTLAPSVSTRLADRYFKSLLREANEAPVGKLLVDKNPSLTPALHIWLKIFAKIKIIITLRDPRDVIISCYFQNLPLTASNVNFLSIDKSVKFYSACMDTWMRMREMPGFEWIEIRYEEIVGNLKTEGKRMMDFLGLPWQEAQANFYEPKQRNFILASAYDDVTKPLYNKSVARWKHYAEALEPVRPELEKYCRAFGYQ